MPPSLFVFALFFAGLYFLLLRPQKQRVRRQRELLTAIGVGDRVVTAGGLIGRVVDESDDRLQLEIADGVVVEFLRMAISRRLDDSEQGFYAPGADDEEEEDEVEALDEARLEDGEPAGGSASELHDGEAVSKAAGRGSGEAVTGTTVEPTIGATSTDGSTQETAAPAPGQDPH